MRLNITFVSLAIVLLACVQTTAHAQLTTIENEDYKQPTIHKMTVSPAAEPKPALKHHFLVPLVDRIRGNAATFYYKSMVIEGRDWVRDIGDRDDLHEKWLVAPLNQIPQEAREALKKVDQDSLHSLDTASRCEDCDWGDNIREFGVSTPLPQAQKSRSLASVLCLRARVQLADKQVNEAIATLRYGYSMSRNLSKGCCLVQDLIGIAFQGMLDEQTRELIATPDSPNLYWAITELAASPIDLRRAISYESKMWDFTVHELADLDRRELSAEEALKLAARIQQTTERTAQSPGEVLIWAMQLEPEARAYLLNQGYAKNKLDAMPVLQVVLLYRWLQFQIVRDDCFKWLQLPESEIRLKIPRSEKAVQAAAQMGKGQPFTSLLPAIYPAHYARLRSLRHTSALRIVEALRMFAAEQGRWPAALDDIKAVPIPKDPVTTKPFEYSVQDGVAILSSPPDDGNKHSGNFWAQRYELTLRATKPSSASEK